MSAVIINHTRFPMRSIQKTTHWALTELDVNLASLVVRVRESHSRTHSGRFWPHARSHWARVWNRETGKERLIQPNIPLGTEHLIVARISINPSGPGNRVKRGGPPPFWPETWEESMICIIAHEGMHFRQFLFPKEGGPRWSEVEAEWAEYRLLKRWRER